MDKINDGGPAFPCQLHNVECNHPTGMTLRDYLAGQALQGLLTQWSPKINDDYEEKELELRRYHMELVARTVYDYADAMLAQRTRKEP